PKMRLVNVKTSVQILYEFLSLPIWKARHELYAAWIFCEIINAIESDRPHIHANGQQLVFSFSGAHLATLQSYSPNLQLWCELRTPLKNPRGKSRKNAIQPDYSLAIGPVNYTKNTIIVVECKQYKVPSIKNFADALRDYAVGRENARVI